MTWFEASTDIALPVDYEVDGEFVIPDSATYKVRGHDGAQIETGSLPAATTSDTLVVASANNSISALWENRYVTVAFLAGGATHTLNFAYKLAAFLPMSATSEDVRASLGLNKQELPDRDVDLIASYFTLVDTYGAKISEALTETGVRNSAVNEAIVVNSALRVLASAPLRTLITVRSEDSSASRLKELDFDALGRKLEAKLSTLIDTARNTTPATPVTFGFSEPEGVFS